MSGKSHPPADVVIVGGGAIGLAIAWRAAREGLQVTVADPAPGSGASNVAAGMLTPVTEAHFGEEAQLRLSLRSAAAYPEFVAELEEASGLPVGYRTCGMLAVAFDAGDHAVLTRLREFQQSLGLEVEPLSGRECRLLEPMLSPSVHGGILVAGDHQIDPRKLIRALLVAAERAGVRIVRSSVARVLVDDDAVVGVALDDESVLHVPTVVIAAGCRSGEIAGIPGHLRLPVRPVKGQVLRLSMPRDSAPLLSRSVRGTVRGKPVYLVPRRDGELVIGATQEERGWDDQVTAGGVYDLLRDAHTIVPGITELPLAETSAALRPGSPDNAPMIGPMPLKGLVAATGHFRNGILLTPVTAEAVSELLTKGALPAFAAPFTPRRFAGREVRA